MIFLFTPNIVSTDCLCYDARVTFHSGLSPFSFFFRAHIVSECTTYIRDALHTVEWTNKRTGRHSNGSFFCFQSGGFLTGCPRGDRLTPLDALTIANGLAGFLFEKRGKRENQFKSLSWGKKDKEKRSNISITIPFSHRRSLLSNIRQYFLSCDSLGHFVSLSVHPSVCPSICSFVCLSQAPGLSTHYLILTLSGKSSIFCAARIHHQIILLIPPASL